MIKHTSLLAALLLLSTGARAQIVAGAASEAAAWVGPMSAAVTAAGSERVAGLGSVSLTNLSMPDASGRLPFVSAPQVLAPLTAALAAQGVTPASFAALPTAERLAVLSRAAVPAEAQAAAAADAALAAVAVPVRNGTYEDASRKTADAEESALYLSPEKAAQVAAAVAAVKKFERRRSQLIKSFLEDLPSKIAAGEINGATLLDRDADGWHAADENPAIRHETLNELYRVRLANLGRAVPGPWTLREVAVLKASLGRRDVAEALSRELKASPGSNLAIEQLVQYLDFHANRAREAIAADPKMFATLKRFEKGSASGVDIRRVEKAYYNSIERAGYSNPWIAGTILSGSLTLPGWEELKALKRQAMKDYHRNALQGMVGFIAAMLMTAAAGASTLPPLAKAAAFALMFVPMAWMFLNIWRRDDFQFEAESVDRYVNRPRRSLLD